MPIAKYMDLIGLKGQVATVTKTWPPRSGKGTSCFIATENFRARGYCSETLSVAQKTKIESHMQDGNCVFLAPLEPDPCSTVDLVIDHDNRITDLERWIPVIEGILHDIDLQKERYPL